MELTITYDVGSLLHASVCMPNYRHIDNDYLYQYWYGNYAK